MTQTDKTVAVVKGLIMDGIAKANSGHPGGAMSSSDFATILFSEFLNTNPDDPNWFNRDRFIMAAGHESMLLYSLLHLNGLLSLDDLKQFRQLGSLTPGHPEVEMPGVEATSGPLGQGFAVSVGFAAAEAFLGEKLGSDVMDHYTYALSCDGDIQEPVALGAASLAGLWGLGKLIVYYDSNKIQLAGPCCDVDCTDHRKVFEGMCWQVIDVDGHNHDEIRAAIKEGQAETSKPTLIIGHTTMAKGAATMEGSHKTHGSPLSAEEIAATKEKLGLPADKDFYVPEDVVEAYRARFDGLRKQAADWEATVDSKLGSDAGFAEMWGHVTKPRPELDIDWPEFTPGETMATRKAWGACLNSVMESLPTLVGGSADLDPSNQTQHFRDTYGDFGVKGFGARNFAFGVREFPMAAIMNGLQLHGGLMPFGATFLTFADYCRNAIRMSALQKLPVLYVFTHDSFWVGEDGPTHQPIEHVSSLRLIPGVIDLRPADAMETAVCLDIALKQEENPSTIFLTRQGLPVLDPAEYPAVVDGPRKGGYVIKDCDGTPDLILIAAGSEVSLALETAKLFKRKVRVVSMPSVKLFDEQPESYKNEVLPPEVTARAAAEAGRTDLWHKFVGLDGVVLGLDHFGASAPGKILSDKYGFTPENFARMIREKY
ncbi:transketolase [uncultured Pseudodesulfovibrio sp.]|uniref:transketolase n=1 Tax=uncultured Pseudodesulfovibrio sp. TaxID=2035858 RepID=UPI0029C662BA|nr:transketolase [uncultured Pseudodesulfovibrio sp.]